MDQNLEFMARMPEEQLQVFVDTLIEKGGITETLSVSEDYKQYGKNYSKYWHRIEVEYRDFGSNTITSFFSGPNTYKEILEKVLKQCKVDFHPSDSVEAKEGLLLESIIKDMWEKLSQSERIALLSDLKNDVDNIDLWSVYDIAGPAYRVIIPCTILIAAYRKMDSTNC